MPHTPFLKPPAKRPYRKIMVGSTRLDAQGIGSLALNESGSGSFGAASSGSRAFYFDPADFDAGEGTAVLLRLRLILLTNDTAPTATFTGALVAVTAAPSGVAATVAIAAGATATGSLVTIATPAADVKALADSGDFASPVAGYYALKLAVTTAGMVANSAAGARIELLAHNA